MTEFVSVDVDSFGVIEMPSEEEQLGSITNMTKIALDPSPTQVELVTFLIIFFFIPERILWFEAKI